MSTESSTFLKTCLAIGGREDTSRNVGVLEGELWLTCSVGRHIEGEKLFLATIGSENGGRNAMQTRAGAAASRMRSGA